MEGGTLQTKLMKNLIRVEATLPEKLFRKPSFTYHELLTHAKEIAEAFLYIHRDCHAEAVILHRGE
jgi:hypothetical protein